MMQYGAGLFVYEPGKFEHSQNGKAEEFVWRHHGCKGEIRTKENEDGLRLALRPCIHRFTPEGDLIEKEYVDGYSSPDREYWDALYESNRKIRVLTLSKNAREESDRVSFLRRQVD